MVSLRQAVLLTFLDPQVPRISILQKNRKVHERRVSTKHAGMHPRHAHHILNVSRISCVVQAHPSFHALSQDLQGQLLGQVVRTTLVELARQGEGVRICSRPMLILPIEYLPHPSLLFVDVAMTRCMPLCLRRCRRVERTPLSGSDDEGDRLTLRPEVLLLSRWIPGDAHPRFLPGMLGRSSSVVYVLEPRHD